MLVTINTDACFHTKLKYGGYAFWAVSDDFKITKSGVFRKKCQTSDDAESKCIINALTVILKAHKGITKIIVNTDSLNAIAYLTKDTKHISRYGLSGSKMRQFQQCLTMLPIGKIKIEYRHVKAHSNVDDSRSFVNEWCDTNAKKMMWAKINNSKTV